jgi:Ser/Thr protein kinase RdoA (MazF antagonist)
MSIENVMRQFTLSPSEFTAERISAGYINQTYRLSGKQKFILQRINTYVFTRPDYIANNLNVASRYLRQNFPDYTFLSTVPTLTGHEMAYDDEGQPWRLFPYIENTMTVNQVKTEDEAFHAASGFAELAAKLAGCDVALFKPTIDRFHDLSWRFEQFETALQNTSKERKLRAADAIHQCLRYRYLVSQYEKNIGSGILKLRVMHNDTKINNILFDRHTGKTVCVIDLDTLMPGYFIYDFGDMVRTFVSPVSEEERDLSKIEFRFPMYTALCEGYLLHMRNILGPEEKKLFRFGGMMMTYIMALRMLADFLNGNVYYLVSYEEQNLVRAMNQLRLLEILDQNLPA